MDELDDLRKRIREGEELLNHINKHNLLLSEDGYSFIINEVRILRIELAELEAKQSENLRRLQTCN